MTTLTPVFGTAGCAGHLLRTARGYRAFDHEEKYIGNFEDIGSGTKALLEPTTEMKGAKETRAK
jgi:hypothetical protein